MEPCIYEGKIAEINTKLTGLKENFDTFKNNDFHELKVQIGSMLEKMNKPRVPLWVTWVLTLSSGLIVGLVVSLLKK